MKAYKGFLKTNDGRLYCQPSGSSNIFYYEEGNTYTLPEGDKPELCRCGFHACTNPTDVFSYYSSNMGNVEFHEVELEGATGERSNDSKVCAKKITIGRKITPDEMVEISIKMMLSDKEKYFMGRTCVIVRKDNKVNYLQKDGTILSDAWFDWCGSFKEGLAPIRIDNKWNYIKTDGKILSETWFDYMLCNFSKGFARIKKDDKWNFIDTDGKLISDTWFDQCCNFYEGFGRVCIGDKWNFIDKEGKITES